MTTQKALPSTQKVPPDSAVYVDSPGSNFVCDECKFFERPASGNTNGKCGIVEGSIAAKGTCFLWEKGPTLAPGETDGWMKTKQRTGGYTPPNGTKGGFGCKRCKFFGNPGCSIVDVKATANGCCNLWQG